MAVFKVISVPQKYADEDAYADLIHYCIRPMKTPGNFIDGFGVLPQLAAEQMQIVSHAYRQDHGIRLRHWIIPREFDEAVYMDGGSVFTVFFKVICPLASPAIASVSIFNFLTAWEEFPWALTVLNDTQKRTLPIAISGFFGQHQFTQWGYVFAMSVASLLPVLIIFICCQKYFVSGLQTGGIKG